LLTVTDLGLASCWVGAFDEGKAAKILGLEDHVRPLCMLPIGYAADEPKPPKRKPLSDVVKYLD
jgi:nitroreductase